ncbi:MAG: universal stress protein [Candidatus Limnocylindrales bacterium]
MPDAHPHSFRRVVIGLSGGPTDALVVRLACELTRAAKASLVGVHVVEVTWSHDLAEDIASGNEAASAVLDLAEGVAERNGCRMETSLLQARDVGAALVDEAAALGADLLLLGLPYRKKFGGDFAIGRTVPYVLQNAPCEVLVVREPIASQAARGREPAVAVGAGLGAPDRL